MSKTIFILAGGNDRTSKDYGRRLSEEITRHATELRILSCFFSSPAEIWEEKFHDWKSWFTDHFTQPFTYDYAKPEIFLKQIDNANAIYFHGGDTNLLLHTLPDTNALKHYFKGKIVIGSSAGANMLSTYFWSSTRGVFGNGRCILDINVMVHYGALDTGGYKRTKEDWEREEFEFQQRIAGQAITRLPEGEFVVLEREIL